MGRSTALIGQTAPWTSSPNSAQTACTRIVLKAQLPEMGNSGNCGRGLEWVESLMGVGPVGSDDRQCCLPPTPTSCLINTPVLLGPLPLSRWGSRWLVCHSPNCCACLPLPPLSHMSPLGLLDLVSGLREDAQGWLADPLSFWLVEELFCGSVIC